MGDSVWASVRASVGDSVRDSVWDSVYGQHEAAWLSWVDYFRDVCGLDSETQKLFGIFEVAKSAGWWLPHENICWISERCNILNRNKEGRLHFDGGPALAYPDGWSIWALNGVRVSQDLAETPKEKLDIELFKKENNADIRAEFIRKYGIERMTALGEIIESASEDSGEWERRSEYQLINMGAIFGVERAIFLKMKNQSTGIYHLEGVAPECKSIKDALNYRYGSKIEIQSIK